MKIRKYDAGKPGIAAITVNRFTVKFRELQ